MILGCPLDGRWLLTHPRKLEDGLHLPRIIPAAGKTHMYLVVCLVSLNMSVFLLSTD